MIINLPEMKDTECCQDVLTNEVKDLINMNVQCGLTQSQEEEFDKMATNKGAVAAEPERKISVSFDGMP